MTFAMNFKASEPFTLGAEIEFQLLDLNTFDLTSAAPGILDRIPPEFKDKIKPEFIQSMVEVATGVCANISELEDDLRASIKILDAQAREAGCRLFSTSLHPFAKYREQVASEDERYKKLMEDLQIAGRRLISQGLHVHVGLPEPETIIQVCDNIRVYLPILLALSTSSPFYQGEDSGFHSYRSRLLDGLSRSGMPQTLGSWGRFQKLMAVLHKAGIIEDIRDIWWDVRPHPDFGTVEVRICDLPSRFSEILSLVALIQALVITLSKKTPEEHPARPSMELLLSNKWQAARYGLEGKFIYPDNAGNPTTMKEAATDLLETVYPAARDHGTLSHLGNLKRVIQQGTSSSRMRMMREKNFEFDQIINELHGDYWL